METVSENEIPEEELRRWREKEVAACDLHNNSVASLRRQLAEKAFESCDVCGGTGKPVSGLPCICNGSGKLYVTAIEMRKLLYDQDLELVKLREMLAKIQNASFEGCEWGCLHCGEVNELASQSGIAKLEDVRDLERNAEQ